MMHRSAQTPAPPRDFGELRSGAGMSMAANSRRDEFISYEQNSNASTAGFDIWAAHNPAAVAWIENRFLWYAAQGRHFSFALIWEECRYHRCAENGRNLWKMPND